VANISGAWKHRLIKIIVAAGCQGPSRVELRAMTLSEVSMAQPLLTRYMQPLLNGQRAECFDLVSQALAESTPAAELICDVVWPAMAQVQRLFEDDRINTAVEHMACRINRTVADQLQQHLPRHPANGKRALVVCDDGSQEELGAQMVCDLLQAQGWEVFFIGGGVPHDELLTSVGQIRPHIFVIFGTRPEGVPDSRKLIELIREVGACPTMNMVVSGGVFNRADGLWQEVGADVFCATAKELIEVADSIQPRLPNARSLGIVKKRRRRRRGTEIAAAVAPIAEAGSRISA
jgi:MerR family transcriptional regulator, light-induced transcriptional regulator